MIEELQPQVVGRGTAVVLLVLDVNSVDLSVNAFILSDITSAAGICLRSYLSYNLRQRSEAQRIILSVG